MTNQETLEATIFASSHPDIVKRISTSGILLTVGMLVVGFVVFFSAFQLDDASSTSSMFLMVAGTVLLLLAVFRLFWKSKQLIYAPTGSTTRESSMHFDTKNLDRLIAIFEDRTFSPDHVLQGRDNGNIRVDILKSQDNKFAAIQIFQFVPYTYNPVTPVYYFTGDQASTVSHYLQLCKRK